MKMKCKIGEVRSSSPRGDVSYNCYSGSQTLLSSYF